MCTCTEFYRPNPTSNDDVTVSSMGPLIPSLEYIYIHRNVCISMYLTTKKIHIHVYIYIYTIHTRRVYHLRECEGCSLKTLLRPLELLCCVALYPRASRCPIFEDFCSITRGSYDSWNRQPQLLDIWGPCGLKTANPFP